MPRLACVAHAVVVSALVLLASCADTGSGKPQCEDGVDNDRDGFIDEADPACAAGSPTEAEDPAGPCGDGVDNDGDGLTDFPDDPGCDGDGDVDEYDVGDMADCMNGRDDDGDGKIDFPADPGCLAANQDGEGDDCPTGPNCPQCANGRDDDVDTLVDFPTDPGCTSASGGFEYNLDVNACGTGTLVAELPANGIVTGTLSTGTSNVQASTCAGGPVGTGAEAAYAFLVESPSTLVATTDTAGTTANTVLYVRRACRTAATELACNDDINPTNTKSSIRAELTPGAYYLIVDTKAGSQTGAYTLQASIYRGLGQSCTGAVQCAPGNECRMVAGAGTTTCERPVCSDGRDDDGDTKIDFPADPGCTSAIDSSETDDCPNGVNCPDCADTVDNDGDTRADYPLDTACASASGTSEYACTSADPVRTFAGNLTGQTMPTLGNDVDLSCGTNGRDEVFALLITRPLAELRINTIGSTIDTSIALKQASCSSFDLACDDDTAGNGDSEIFLVDVQVGEYYLVVDDESTTGTYNLNVRGTLTSDASCDPASTLFTCPTGFSCAGTAGAERCTAAACNDAVDGDGDGDGTGYPTDPGCASPSDTTEDDDCPAGPSCPACSNDVDDDNDTLTDYGADPGCVAASATSELAPCTSGDPVLLLNNPRVVDASTATRSNDVDLSCGTDGRDEIYRLMVIQPLASLTVDTVGSSLDTVVGLRGATCNGTADLACDDNGAGNGDSRVTLTNVGVGEYFVVVDDRNVANPGTYNLNVTGTIAVGGQCDPASTVYTCTAGHACTGAPMATCQLAACNNAVDDDGRGDGTGFPTDPGCASTSDNDEADDCPSGPMCPACSNDLDDDGDGLTDYPEDPACAGAGVASELAPCTSIDPIPVFTADLAGVSIATQANDVDLSCGNDGRDLIYRYYVTAPLVSLTADTGGSDTNAAIALRRNSCNGNTDLGCAVNNYANGDARATITGVTVGEYFILVDDQNTATPTTISVNLRGVIPSLGRCNPSSTTFVCDTGTTCRGAAGAERCSPGVCNDTVDDDGRGDGTGFPTDPGCTSVADTDEADDCPTGTSCPACSNGLDDDGNGTIDFPADLGCAAASDTVERTCAPETDPFTVVSTRVTTGTTTGAANNFSPSCQSTSNADRVHLLSLPVPVASLTMTTVGTSYDTILVFMDSGCGTSLACNDDGAGVQSTITRTDVAAGTYAIVVDGYDMNSGPYTLNVNGTVAAGVACTDPLFAAGVLACAGTCTAGTCQ